VPTPSVPPPPSPPPPGAVSDQVGRFARFVALFGWRAFPSEWDPFDDQFAFQFGGTHEWGGSPVGVEWGMGFSTNTRRIGNREFTSQSFELSLGPTKTFHLADGRWFTNLGAGLAWTYTEEGDSTFCCDIIGQDANWFAFYGHAGLIYRVLPFMDVVLDLRGLTGETLDFGTYRLPGRYLQLALGFGFSF
jgi:hypothetical protein